MCLAVKICDSVFAQNRKTDNVRPTLKFGDILFYFLTTWAALLPGFTWLYLAFTKFFRRFGAAMFTISRRQLSVSRARFPFLRHLFFIAIFSHACVFFFCAPRPACCLTAHRNAIHRLRFKRAFTAAYPRQHTAYRCVASIAKSPDRDASSTNPTTNSAAASAPRSLTSPLRLASCHSSTFLPNNGF